MPTAVKKTTPPAAKAAATPVKTAATPVAATTSATKKKAATPVKTAPVVEKKVDEPNVEETVEEPKVEEVSALSVLTEKVGALASLLKEVQTSLKAVTKEYEKQSKIIEKVQKKRDNARKSPSGFAKPNKISDELCDFLGVPHGTEKSRTDVTRFINAYVKEHNLNNPANKRVILPDAKLKSILNVKDDEEVTFFILQRLISHHFPLSLSKMNANAANNAAIVPPATQ